MDMFKNLQMEMALKEMKSNMEIIVEHGVLVSKVLKEYYNALINQVLCEG